MAREKWIMATKEMYLGYCGVTCRRGSVLEVDRDAGFMWIDGRKFNTLSDMDILLRNREQHPESSWIVPYLKETLAEYTKVVEVKTPAKKAPTDHSMVVVESDQDLNEEIDIRSTQISKIHNKEKEDERQRAKTGALEVVKGDQTVTDRLAELASKTDTKSMAERLRLKESLPAKLPVVHDDSLGAGFGEKAMTMNAGQHLISREEAESRKSRTALIAASFKAEAEAKKKRAMAARGEVDDGTGIVTEEPEDLEDSNEVVAEVAEVADVSSPQKGLEQDVIKALQFEIVMLKERVDTLERLVEDNPIGWFGKESKQDKLIKVKKAKKVKE